MAQKTNIPDKCGPKFKPLDQLLQVNEAFTTADQRVNELVSFTSLSSSQKQSAITEELLEKAIDVLGIQGWAKDLVLTDQLIEDLRRVICQMRYIKLQPGNSFAGPESVHVYIVLQGKFSPAPQESSFQESTLASQSVNNPFPIIGLGANASQVTAVTYCHCLRLSNVAYVQFMKKQKASQNTLLSRFLSQWLHISTFQVQTMKIIPKVQVVKVKRNSRISANDGSVWILRKGLITPLSTLQQPTLNGAGTVLCFDQPRVQKGFLIVENSTFIKLPEKLVKTLQISVQNFKGILQKHIEVLQIKRNNFFCKSDDKENQPETPKRTLKTTEQLTLSTRAISSKRFRKRLSDVEQTETLTVQFARNLPYEAIIKGKEVVRAKSAAACRAKHHSKVKATVYLEQAQLKKKKHNEKISKLKLKSIAEREMNMQVSGQQCIRNIKTSVIKGNLFEDDESTETHSEKADDYYLSSDDTGIINQFAKNSHVYQKHIDNILDKRIKQAGKKEGQFSGSQYSTRRLKQLLFDYVRPSILAGVVQEPREKIFELLKTSASSNVQGHFMNNYLKVKLNGGTSMKRCRTKHQ